MSDIGDKELKKLGKKLKQIEKLELLDRELNPDEQNKIASKDDILQKMKELSLDWLYCLSLTVILCMLFPLTL